MPSKDETVVFPPKIDAKTLQYRLETGNIAKQGGQRGSLTRCAQKFGAFRNSLLASKPDAEKIESSKQELNHDIDLFSLELLKLVLLQQNLKSQVASNQETIEGRQAEIDEWSKEVKASQSEANQAQQTKRCFEEYEALAKMTMELHPETTSDLKKQLEEAQQQISQLQKEKATLDHISKVREGQFQLLIQYMNDLKRSINDPDEDEKLSVLGERAQDQKSGDASAANGNEDNSMDVDDEDGGLYGDI